ncbi:protein kinase-like protein [Babesia gibsoni]|uniref:non-specific serine/threonine protein kinase n=1 Tax=Babesia gibsoni TaxID=33632 RepID=A0AAD8LJW8_BABGI|nr:protein kinase-like protein [Babesia gibsoni]
MAFTTEQRQSVTSRLHGSTRLLLIQSLCGPLTVIADLQVLQRTSESSILGGKCRAIDLSKLHDSVSTFMSSRTSGKDAGVEAEEYVSSSSSARDRIEAEIGAMRDSNAIGTGSNEATQHESQCFTNPDEGAYTPSFQRFKGILRIHGNKITILPGVTYDFSIMMLYLNLEVSVTVIAAIAVYLTVSLCGLYRFVDIFQEYFSGCTCRICKREFQILRPIEGGAYGSIYLAKYVGAKNNFDFDVVLKSIHIEGLSSISGTQQECRKLLSLKHKYVMKYYDDFLHREWSWNPLLQAKLYCVMVTEFCERGNLADLIERDYSNFTEEYIFSIFKKVVMGLQYIHEQSVIHRDIKSPNIMLKDNDVVRLGDFGLSDTFASKNASKKTKSSRTLEFAAMNAQKSKTSEYTESVEYNRSGSLAESFTIEEINFDDWFLSDDDNANTENTDDNERQSPDTVTARHDKTARAEKPMKVNKRKGHGKRNKAKVPLSDDNKPPVESAITESNSRFFRFFKGYTCNNREQQKSIFREKSKSYSEQIGTRCYMAPEIMTNCTYGRASDIWALGCVLLELCSGVFMWELDYNLGDCPENVTTLVKNLPPMISRTTRGLITKMLSVDPEKRPSAAQILSSRALKSGIKRSSRLKSQEYSY